MLKFDFFIQQTIFTLINNLIINIILIKNHVRSNITNGTATYGQ
jgi:hypothetical protein